MNISFADTLYFKEDNILKILLGSHRTYKLIHQEISTETRKNNLTLNEFLILIEIRKGFKKKIDLSKKLIIKRQNINIIFKNLEDKKLISNLDNAKVELTENGKKNLDKSIKKISERIMVLFKKTDSKYMSGFINVIENL